MNYKHIKMSNGIAELFLYDDIGGHGITASQIVSEIEWLANFGSEKELLVHINSGGGDMVEGFGIFSALQNAKKQHEMVVNVQIDGLAASMASFIAMVGDNISIVDFGMIMIHDPSMPGGGSMSPKQKEIIDKFKSAADTVYQARTGKSSDDLNAMMANETWMNAEEAVANGFADSILKTDLSKVAAEIHTILNEGDYKAKRDVLFSEQYNPIMHTFNEPKNANKSNTNMKKIAMTFGLDSSASEQAVENKAQELVNKVSSLEKDNAAMKTEIENKDTEIKDLGDKIAVSNKATATQMIDAAITEGKIKKEKREEMIEKATKEPEMVRELLDSVESKKPAATDTTLLDAVKAVNGANGNPGIAPKMSLREMEQKHPEKVLEIKNTNPELYAEMYKEQYGVELA